MTSDATPPRPALRLLERPRRPPPTPRAPARVAWWERWLFGVGVNGGR